MYDGFLNGQLENKGQGTESKIPPAHVAMDPRAFAMWLRVICFYSLTCHLSSTIPRTSSDSFCKLSVIPLASSITPSITNNKRFMYGIVRTHVNYIPYGLFINKRWTGFYKIINRWPLEIQVDSVINGK